MSEVLIRGMEMPKNCKECKIKGEGSDSLYTWSCPFTGFEYTRYDCVNDRLDDCPLVEVPNPHGRLIDTDELYGAIVDKGQRNERGKYRIGDFWELNGCEIREVIDRQPTIIEAEGSGT